MEIIKRICVKLSSFKNLIAIWVMFILTYIVIKRPELETLAITLVGILATYFAANQVQKVFGERNE